MLPPIGVDVWRDGALSVPAGSYVDLFTGQPRESRGNLRLADVFSDFPVAAPEERDWSLCRGCPALRGLCSGPGSVEADGEVVEA